MLKNRFADKILDQLKFFYDNEISMHLQIVLCPGYNDGKELEKTLEDLYELTPFADSVGIVPVGITKFRKDLPTLKLVDEKVAEKTFKIAKKFQKRAYDYYGVKWVYLADEFFIKIGKKIPSRSYYANFPQIENGIGISRLFIDSFKRAAKKKEFKNKAPYIVCGKIASYVIKPLLEETNAKAEFIVVENEFFGKTITVTGLLTAKDIFYNIRKFAKKNKPILIPDIIFNENEITLDGVKKEEFYKFDGRIKIIKTKGYALVREL
jgi:NifB/MoaA-like Fe-S oxidoreductase